MAKELTNKQKAAAEFMVANPEMGYDEVAEKLGVNPATLWRWRKREDFKEYSHSLCMERFRDLEKLAIRKLQENIMKNNQKAVEYALDYVGFKSPDTVEIKDKVIKIEIEE
jgi:uncharacterized protein YjcR